MSQSTPTGPNTSPTNGLERALAAQAQRTPPGACETCLGVGLVLVPRAGSWYETPCTDCGALAGLYDKLERERAHMKPTPILHVGRFARVRHVGCYLGRPTVFHSVESYQGQRVYIWSRRTSGAFTVWELPRFT